MLSTFSINWSSDEGLFVQILPKTKINHKIIHLSIDLYSILLQYSMKEIIAEEKEVDEHGNIILIRYWYKDGTYSEKKVSVTPKNKE